MQLVHSAAVQHGAGGRRCRCRGYLIYVGFDDWVKGGIVLVRGRLMVVYMIGAVYTRGATPGTAAAIHIGQMIEGVDGLL